jgi:hypothetical protein
LIKAIKPPGFDGKNVIDWIFKIHSYMLAIDATATDEERMMFACNLLTGRALTWWRHQLSFSA